MGSCPGPCRSPGPAWGPLLPGLTAVSAGAEPPRNRAGLDAADPAHCGPGTSGSPDKREGSGLQTFQEHKCAFPFRGLSHRGPGAYEQRKGLGGLGNLAAAPLRLKVHRSAVMKPKATKSPSLRPRAGSRQGRASFSQIRGSKTPCSRSQRIARPRALANILWPWGSAPASRAVRLPRRVSFQSPPD